MRLTTILSLLVLSSSCVTSPDPDYVSTCGARYYGTDPVGFQHAEDKAVSIMGVECGRMAGWSVTTVDATWVDAWGHKQAAVSGCDEADQQRGWAMLIADWREPGYWHEVTHHMQCPLEDREHATWTTEMQAAIRRATVAP